MEAVPVLAADPAARPGAAVVADEVLRAPADEVVAALGGLGPVTVRERGVAEETVRFALPRKAQQ